MLRLSHKPVFYLASILLLCACASDPVVLAPNLAEGDPIKPEYLVGKWCNNRELTSTANAEAGVSTLANLGKQFWKLRASGKWENSETGWIYAHYGKWQLQGPDTVLLDRLRGDPVSYQASFRNSGVDLYLLDESGQFLVVSRCD
ncbi:MAG: hypothetical protein OEN02_10265 [Gammaproteobacteria bacterium]|nr:hypothetical protein [Gammaproteobacteria bacterium]MDH3537398.1 hypothetical protein [Gammaproteobacteria bacterium]